MEILKYASTLVMKFESLIENKEKKNVLDIEHCICCSCCRPTQKSLLELQSLMLGCDLGIHRQLCPGTTVLQVSKMCALSHDLPIMLEQCHKL